MGEWTRPRSAGELGRTVLDPVEGLGGPLYLRAQHTIMVGALSSFLARGHALDTGASFPGVEYDPVAPTVDSRTPCSAGNGEQEPSGVPCLRTWGAVGVLSP